MPAAVIFGLSNCDTTRKALHWLKAHNIPFEFHDFKIKGVTRGKLEGWVKAAGVATVLNKRGTTWRGLDLQSQEACENLAAAVSLMQQHTSLIKRPILEYKGKLVIGFDENNYRSLFLPA